MNINEAKSAGKALFLQSAALAGYEVSSFSPERFADLLDQGFSKVEKSRRPEAVANLLRVIAATLEVAQERGDTQLQETTVSAAKEKVCPVYPFK
jgi:hypothetical protein